MQRPRGMKGFGELRKHSPGQCNAGNCFLFSFLQIIIVYLFMAALGLRCCAPAFSSCGERGPLFVAARGLLIEVASLVEKHRL